MLILHCWWTMPAHQYGQQSALVCQFVRDHYLRPAKRAGQRSVRVVVGDVHRQLKLSNRVPLVCQALTSKKFLQENSLRLVDRTGPPSGQSTTVAFTYEIVDQSNETPSSLLALRGAGRQVFAELGGGESFLQAERAAFSGSSRKEQL